MNRFPLRNFALAAGTLIGSAALVGCEENKGPMERAGENVDKAARNVGDAVNPPSTPGEKAGSAIDKATGNK